MQAGAVHVSVEEAAACKSQARAPVLPRLGPLAGPASVLALQRAAGNRAVAGLARTQMLQRACCGSCAAGHACEEEEEEEEEEELGARAIARLGPRPPAVLARRSWWDDVKDTAGAAVDAVSDAAHGVVAGAQELASDAAAAVTTATHAAQDAWESATAPIVSPVNPLPKVLGGGGAAAGGGGGSSSAGGLLSSGSGGAAVTDLQSLLTAAGYAVPLTRIFDGPTAAAVKAFQAAAGLVVDGIVGSKTFKVLREGLASADEPIPEVRAAWFRPGGGTFWEEAGMYVKGPLRCIASIVGWETMAYAFPELAKKKNATEVMQYLVEVGLFAVILQSDKICHCIPSSWILIGARIYLSDYPLALAHFDHYLEGSGADLVENLPKLFADNPEMLGIVRDTINENGTLEGDVTSIKQIDYKSKEWQLALGNIDHVFYKVLRVDPSGAVVTRLTLRDPYQWHPAEYTRGGEESRCVHVAAEFAKETGAREFNEVGTAEFLLSLKPELVKKASGP